MPVHAKNRVMEHHAPQAETAGSEEGGSARAPADNGVVTVPASGRRKPKTAAPDVPVDVNPARARELEAVLISLDRAIQPAKLAAGLGLVPGHDDAGGEPAAEGPALRAAVKQIEAMVSHLNGEYEATGRSFRVELLAGGYRVMTLPAYAQTLAAFHRSRASTKLTRAAIEALAIIAYKQPITRAELEAIRGVSCGEVLKTLLERRLVTVKGRAEELGRPMLYGTTAQFLQHFGLASIKDLPQPGELQLGDAFKA